MIGKGKGGIKRLLSAKAAAHNPKIKTLVLWRID
jgi:hypothetical protein